MAEITLEQVPRKLRDTFEKANLAMERGNPKYAVDMYQQILKAEPRFLTARRNMRVAQVKMAMDAKPSAMTHQMSSLKGTFTLMGGQGKLNKDSKASLESAEKLLQSDPLNLSFLKFYVDAATAAEMPEAAVMTLELARPYHAKNVEFLRLLAKLYIETNNPGGAKDCYNVVVQLLPNDQVAIKNLKDAAALDTMKVGNWEEKGDFRQKLKNKQESIRLEQQQRTMQGDADVDDLIKARLQDIEREPQNMNFRRALADLYLRANRFDDALQALDDATKAAGRSDPQIERTVTSIKVKQYDAAIADAKAANDSPQAAALETQKEEFIFADAIDMVKRYPNDLQCRYDLGVQYFQRNMFTEAIEEFQLAQRNPQRRTRALYYLARCFEEKGQLDIAFEQLKKASSEMSLMDDDKKDVVYEMGVLTERMGKKDEALGYFKEIYAVDIKYRDVAARIESAYQK